MKILGIISICFFALCYLIIIITAFFTGKSIKRLLLNAVFGLTVLALIDVTARFSEVYIPINLYTVIGVSTFGIPAVIGFLVLPLIFY